MDLAVLLDLADRVAAACRRRLPRWPQFAIAACFAVAFVGAVPGGLAAADGEPAPAATGEASQPAAPATAEPAAHPTETLAAEVKADEADITETLEELRLQLREAVSTLPELPEHVDEALAEAGDGGAGRWLPSAIGLGIVAIGLGAVANLLFQRWARRRWLSNLPTQPEELYQRVSYLLVCTAIGVAGAVALGIVAWIVNEFVHGGVPLAHRTVLIMIASTEISLVAIAVLRCIIAPHMPAQRVLNLDDREASRLTLQFSIVVVLGTAFLAINTWLEGLDAFAGGIRNEFDPERDLIAIIMSAATVLLLVWVCISNRRTVADAILPRDGRPVPAWKRWLVGHWHIFVILYFLLAWAVRSVRLLLDRPGAEGLVTAPVLILFAGLGVYGIAVLVIERTMKRLPELRTAGADSKRIADYRDLFERGAGMVITFACLAVVLHLWGVDFIGQSDIGGRIFDVLVVVFMGWLAYDAVKIWIDRKIAEEDPAESAAEGVDVDSGDAPMATGKSRLATILPLVRFFLLASIVVIVAMMALSQIGVDITPLFAGAGVVGLAIGFGSRQLVEDVISGAFYLVDDAFRVGEYIDIGKVKGTVEKISIRSFQLRHQNGPLNTIRFGEVASVTNFSRDWAIMKLPLRVPLDADSEKIRKLIKNVGQQLLEDETYGPMFLQPLKSQGTYEMDDSAQIIRVKFMTKPNDQFVLRRVVYHRIQEAFKKAGISFANRVVTVRVEGEAGTPEYAAARKHAIEAGASEAVEAADEAAAKKAAG